MKVILNTNTQRSERDVNNKFIGAKPSGKKMETIPFLYTHS
jgi:hypothetical protein